MTSRTWVKLYCDRWLSGSLRQETPELRGIWADLLALAGSGKYGDTGRISLQNDVGLSDSQLGKLLKITKYRWQEVNGLGRKRLHPAGNKVLASLQTSGRVTLTAQEHGVSRGSIRNALKAIGVTPADVIKKIATKDNTLLHNGGLND